MYRSLFSLRVINCGYNQSRLITSAAANTLKVKDEVKRKRELALLGGGQKRIDVQHKKGALVFENENITSFFALREINGT
jgi:hypothetical protein